MSILSSNIIWDYCALLLLTLGLVDAVLDGTLGFDKTCTGVGASYNFFSQNCRGASPIIMPKPCSGIKDSMEGNDVAQTWTRSTAADVKDPCDLSDIDFSEDVDCVGRWEKCGKDCGRHTYTILREARGNGTACAHVNNYEEDCKQGMDDCGKADSTDAPADTGRRLLNAEASGKRRLQDDDDATAACYETNWFNPSIVEKDVLVYDKTSLDSFLDVAIDIDGTYWGVKTGFSLDFAKSHIETKTGFSYMSTVTASTTKTTIRNARNMKLADSAKSLLASGPDGAKEFLERYGTYYVSSFYRGSVFIGSQQYKTSWSDDQTKAKEEFGLGYEGMNYSIDVNQGLEQRDDRTDVSADIKNYYQISGSLGQTLSTDDEVEQTYVREKKCRWLKELRENADKNDLDLMERITAIMRMDYRTWYDLEEVRQIIDQYDDQIVAMFNIEPPTELFFQWLAKETAHTWQSRKNVEDMLQWRCVDENPDLKDAMNALLSDIKDHQFAIDSLSPSKLQVLWTEFSCSCSNLGQANCPSECPSKFTFFVAESGVYEDKLDQLTSRYQCDERYISTMQLETEPENQLYAIEKDTNFVYHDLSGSKGHSFNTWQWCATMCNRNPSCRAWSWHEPHDDNIAYRRHCYLKSSDAGRRKWLTDKQIWSGYRLSMGVSKADVSVSNAVNVPELNMILKRRSAIASGIQIITGDNSAKCSNQGPLVKSLGLIGYAVTGKVPHAPEYHEVHGGDFIAGRTTQVACPGNAYLTGLKISYNPTNGDKGPSCVSGPACAAAVPRSIDLRCKTLPQGMYGPPGGASPKDSVDVDNSPPAKRFWSIGQQTVRDCFSKCDKVAVPTNFRDLAALMDVADGDKHWIGLHKVDNKLYTVEKGKHDERFEGTAHWKTHGEGKSSSSESVVAFGDSGLWFDVKRDSRHYKCICEETESDQTKGAACKVEVGKNFRGPAHNEDLSGMPLNGVTSVDACSAECTKNAACEYFAYNTVKKQCWLKKNYERTDGDSNTVSGFRCDPSNPASCAPNYTQRRGDIHGWGALDGRGGGEKVRNCAACAALCDQIGACRSYECSPTELKCNLNADAEPNNHLDYMDYMFCAKEQFVDSGALEATSTASSYGPLKSANLRNVGERTSQDCWTECGENGRVAVPYSFDDAAHLMDLAHQQKYWIGLKKYNNVLYRDPARSERYEYFPNWENDEGREKSEENVLANPGTEDAQWIDVKNDHRVAQCICEENLEGNQYTLSTTPTISHSGSSMWYYETLDQGQELSCRDGDYITAVRVEEAGNCGGAYESDDDFKETGQGSVMGKISITCRASSDYIVQDCVKANNVQEGGWSLVRHVPTGNTWHRANDNLLGSETYGVPCGPTCKTAWSTRWEDLDVEELLFSSGDCDSWLVVNAAQIYANFDNENKYIVNSSNGKGNQAIRMDNRPDVPQDPMIALGDARSVTDDGSNLLYLENGFYGYRSGLTHQGQNVYVRGNFVEDDKRENDCYEPCGKKSGWCSYCGRGNACCIYGSGSDAAECQLLSEDDFHGVLDKHTCVTMPNTGDENSYEDTTTAVDSEACFWSIAYPNKALSGSATSDDTYETLVAAQDACENLGHGCDGVTFRHGKYELHTNKTPVPSTDGAMSWVKETCVTDYVVMSLSVETEKTFIAGAYATLSEAEARLAQLLGQNPRLICETYGPSVGDPRVVDGKPTQGSSEFNVYWRSSQDIAKMMDHCKNRNDFKTYRVVSREHGVLSGSDGTLEAAKAKLETLGDLDNSIICQINADGTVEQAGSSPVSADEVADLLAQCESRSTGCWAKVHSGCDRDPASGFSTRWKKIKHFNGKARECGLLAKGIQSRCGAQPGEVEMRYVSGM